MTYNPMQSVTEFHDKFHRDGKGRHERPISVSTISRRRKLIDEEFDEVMEALDYLTSVTGFTLAEGVDPNRIPNGWANLAKELADLLYVVYGTAEELGIPLEEVFKAVHAHNLTKIWPDGEVHYNDFGKIIKPPDFKPLDLSDVLGY